MTSFDNHSPGPPDPGRTAPEFDLSAALARFAPEVRLHPDDPYRPASILWYLQRTRLRRRRGLFRADAELLPIGQVTPESLSAVSGDEEGGALRKSGSSNNLYVDIPRGPLQRETRRGFRPTGGVVEAPCYVNVRAAPDDPAAFDIQYWFFYAFNGRDGWHIAHEGDWEHITVRVSNTHEPGLLSIYVSAHGLNSGGWVTASDDGAGLRLAPSGRPIVYSALGSHASYPRAGAFSRGRFKSRDRTADGGPVWRTADDLVLVEVNGRRPTDREDEHRWLDFPGRWGAVRRLCWPFAVSGPPGPSYQPSWRAEPAPGQN